MATIKAKAAGATPTGGRTANREAGATYFEVLRSLTTDPDVLRAAEQAEQADLADPVDRSQGEGRTSN